MFAISRQHITEASLTLAASIINPPPGKSSYDCIMNWLEAHAYLATWLALPTAIVVAVVQNAKTGFHEVDWPRSLIYFAFLAALGVAFTPTFDKGARTTAEMLLFFGFVTLIFDKKPR
jgi:hypothetical protein